MPLWTTRQGVMIVTGDMAALRGLIERVQVGWRVEVFSHGCNEGASSGVITALVDDLYGGGPGWRRTLDRPVRSQGRTYTSWHGYWPEEGDDFTVEGNTLREYRNPPPHLGKPRRITAEMTFIAPE